MSYNKYPKEMKEAIIARMLEGDETVKDIQRDTRVGIDTLYRWRDQAKHQKGTQAGKELRAERKEKEKLEEELARKEKALAEAAALLVLRKKADAIWGTDEEDE